MTEETNGGVSGQGFARLEATVKALETSVISGMDAMSQRLDMLESNLKLAAHEALMARSEVAELGNRVAALEVQVAELSTRGA